MTSAVCATTTTDFCSANAVVAYRLRGWMVSHNRTARPVTTTALALQMLVGMAAYTLVAIELRDR